MSNLVIGNYQNILYLVYCVIKSKVKWCNKIKNLTLNLIFYDKLFSIVSKRKKNLNFNYFASNEQSAAEDDYKESEKSQNFHLVTMMMPVTNGLFYIALSSLFYILE